MRDGRPEFLISGAARSGTTFLASLLGFHPDIDVPRIKEPNFFSTRHDLGARWYADLYPGAGSISMDASAQYTYPRLMKDTFERMAPPPETRAVYLVREPLERAFSHYCQEEIYLQNQRTGSFGQAAARWTDAITASDYSQTLPYLTSIFGPDRLLIVPFEQLTGDPEGTVAHVLKWLDLDPDLLGGDEMRASSHLFTNERAEISNQFVRRLFHAARRTRHYPRLRAVLGPKRVRQIRSRLIGSTNLPTLQDGLKSCSREDRGRLEDLRDGAREVVVAALEDQDRRRELNWIDRCEWLRPTASP